MLMYEENISYSYMSRLKPCDVMACTSGYHATSPWFGAPGCASFTQPFFFSGLIKCSTRLAWELITEGPTLG